MPICSGSRSIWIERLGNRHPPPVGHDLGEPAADGEHDVGMRQRHAGPGRAGMAQRERVSLVEQALAVERGDDGCAEPPREGLDLGGRSRPEGASAGQDDRALGPGQDLRGLERSRRPARPVRAEAETPASRSSSGRPPASGPGAERGRPGGDVPTSSPERPGPDSQGYPRCRRTVPHQCVTGRKIPSRSISW